MTKLLINIPESIYEKAKHGTLQLIDLPTLSFAIEEGTSEGRPKVDMGISAVNNFEDYCPGECAVCSYSRKGCPCNLIRRILGVEEG